MELLAKKFDAMGARVRVRELKQPRPFARLRPERPFAAPEWPRLDVRTDHRGEFFDVAVPARTSLEVIDVRPDDRHLLLLARNPKGEKAKFLCGHDERHWFVAAVPETSGATNVITAKQALQPAGVRHALRSKRLKLNEQLRRRNDAYIRQGEWFFVPTDLSFPDTEILPHEPLSRGRGSKPHMMEFAYRRGGTTVQVHRRHAPTGIDQFKFAALDDKVRREPGWQSMVRDPEVYAKGRITHSDHKTVLLRGWHRVYMNTEPQAKAAAQVAFLD